MSLNPLTGPNAEQLDALVHDENMLEKPRGLWAGAWRRLLRRKGGVVGLSMIGFIFFVAIFAPLIAPYDPVLDDFIGDGDSRRRDPPCVHILGCDEENTQHIMGLDGNARDEFSRIVFGSRWSLSIGFFTVALAFSIGSFLGAVSGYWGGHLDNWIMRFMDVILGFPALLLAIAIGATLGPGFRNTMIAIAIVSIPIYARVMRASVL
ncbi:MAG: ABC transporter permease, partial [Acidimicrobiia bacterium]|nr:ABC transporter permease [Acidimicrobiia bacterium]